MKSTRFLGWIALGLVAGAAIVHCGGDDSDSTPPGGGGQGQAGSHAGSSGSSGSSGSLNTGGGASGSSGAGGATQNTGGMAGAAGAAGGAGTGGAAGAATGDAATGDAATGDARDSSSATDAAAANDAVSSTDVTTSSDASASSDVASSSDAGAINDSAAAADGDGGLCPGTKPSDGASCGAFANCPYGNQGRCICSRAGLAADAGRTWRCNAGVDAGGGPDSGAACPATKPEAGIACTDPGTFCQFTATGPCVCVDIGASNEWLCF